MTPENKSIANFARMIACARISAGEDPFTVADDHVSNIEQALNMNQYEDDSSIDGIRKEYFIHE